MSMARQILIQGSKNWVQEESDVFKKEVCAGDACRQGRLYKETSVVSCGWSLEGQVRHGIKE